MKSNILEGLDRWEVRFVVSTIIIFFRIFDFRAF
jgi:hypothetical protein